MAGMAESRDEPTWLVFGKRWEMALGSGYFAEQEWDLAGSESHFMFIGV